MNLHDNTVVAKWDFVFCIEGNVIVSLSDVRIKLNAAELRLCYVNWGIIY